MQFPAPCTFAYDLMEAGVIGMMAILPPLVCASKTNKILSLLATAVFYFLLYRFWCAEPLAYALASTGIAFCWGLLGLCPRDSEEERRLLNPDV